MAATDDDVLRSYLASIAAYPELTADDERRLGRALDSARPARRRLGEPPEAHGAAEDELAEHARRGREAVRSLIESNLRLVVAIAKDDEDSGIPLPELVQHGNLGLLRAAEHYQWRRGQRFSTVAAEHVRRAIDQAAGSGDRGPGSGGPTEPGPGAQAGPPPGGEPGPLRPRARRPRPR